MSLRRVLKCAIAGLKGLAFVRFCPHVRADVAPCVVGPSVGESDLLDQIAVIAVIVHGFDAANGGISVKSCGVSLMFYSRRRFFLASMVSRAQRMIY